MHLGSRSWLEEPLGAPVLCPAPAPAPVPVAESAQFAEPVAVPMAELPPHTAVELQIPATEVLDAEVPLATLDVEGVPVPRESGVYEILAGLTAEVPFEIEAIEAAFEVGPVPPLEGDIETVGAFGVPAAPRLPSEVTGTVLPAALRNESAVAELSSPEPMDIEPATAAGDLPARTDAFAVFAAILADVCMLDGQTAAADKARALSEDLSVLPEAMQSRAAAWRALLRDEGCDFDAVGASMLDEWAAQVVAELVGTTGKVEQYRRELRARGVAAFGLLEAAA